MIAIATDAKIESAAAQRSAALKEKLGRLAMPVEPPIGSSAPAPSVPPAAQGRQQPRWLLPALGGALTLAGAVGGYAASRAGSSAPAPTPAAPASAAATPVAASGAVLSASGYVVARRQATIAPEVMGQIDTILVSEGDSVAPGQILAQLDASAALATTDNAEAEVRGAGAEIERVRAELAEARVVLGRYQALSARGFVRGADLSAAESSVARLEAQLAQAGAQRDGAAAVARAARVRSDEYVVRAPFGGVVIQVNAQPGEVISPGSAGGGFTRTGICTIVDMNSLEIEVDVAEAYIARVRPDQPVSIELAAYPDHRYRGNVIAVVPAADRSRATFKVRVRVHDRDARMLPDMAANVSFNREPRS